MVHNLKLLSVPVLILLMIIGTASFAATTGKIAGVVTDQESGEPLPGVNVTIQGTSMGGATDLDGNYFIINVPPGNYSLSVSMMGYAKLILTDVKVQVDNTSDVNAALQIEAIAGQEVIAVAERPIIERDLTASQTYIEAEDFEKSWVSNITEAMSQENGILTRGEFITMRGGTATDLNYMVDGVSLNSGVIGDNYRGINTTSIQEMRVMTGGFNAEYGSAMSGIVDVVTKDPTGPITGKIKYRYRPAGVYHWGGYMYDHNLLDWTLFDQEFWNNFDGGRPDLTGEERFAMWREFIKGDPVYTDYDKRAEWELESTLSGKITNKLGFLVSGRWLEGVNVFPQAKAYNPQWNGQAKLTYRFNPSMKLTLNGIYGGYESAGRAQSFLATGETSGYADGNVSEPRSYVTSGYSLIKYWPFARFNANLPVKFDMNTYSLKWDHVLSPSTFYEVQVGMYNSVFDMTADNSRFFALYPDDTDWGAEFRNASLLGIGQFRHHAAHIERENVEDTQTMFVKGALTSQINKYHMLKVGGEFKHYDIEYTDHRLKPGPNESPNMSWMNDWDGKPVEGALYLQDKIEVRGMVINAGLRMDFFNAMHDSPTNLWDTWGVWDQSPEHDPNDANGVFSGYDVIPRKKTSWQTRFAPRFGISHPISESTILHFTYGHFNKRPGWIKFLSANSRHRNNARDLNANWERIPHVTKVEKENGFGYTANPLLEFEKMIEYEIGVDQEIANKFRVDATLYYKEGKHLTSTNITTTDQYSVGEGVRDATTEIYSPSPPTKYRSTLATNSGHLDVRGVELTVDAKISQMMVLSASYDYSYSLMGLMGYYRVYHPDMNRANQFQSMGDADQRWLPTDKLKGVANFFLPQDFGPTWGSVKPLGDWNLNFYFEAWSGRLYTAHFPERGDNSTEPLNRRWKPHYRTNLKLTKAFNFSKLVQPVFGIEVRNLFNNKDLRRPSGKELETYLYEDELWMLDFYKNEDLGIDATVPDEWGYYNMNTNPPRQIHLFLTLNF